MNEEYRRGYSKGYVSGMKWPLHKPPEPPNEMVANVMKASKALRDMADVYCATLSPDDEFVKDFAPLIDQIDDAFIKIGEWLVSSGLTPHEGRRGEGSR